MMDRGTFAASQNPKFFALVETRARMISTVQVSYAGLNIREFIPVSMHFVRRRRQAWFGYHIPHLQILHSQPVAVSCQLEIGPSMFYRQLVLSKDLFSWRL